MTGMIIGSILGGILLIFGAIVIAAVVCEVFMDGSWRWGVKDDSEDKDVGDEKDS